MNSFESQALAQPFLTTHEAIYNAFYTQRHLTTQQTLKVLRAADFQT